MPTYFVTWTVTVRGTTRIDADDVENAEQIFLSTEPPAVDQHAEVSEFDVVHVEEAAPGTTWN